VQNPVVNVQKNVIRWLSRVKKVKETIVYFSILLFTIFIYSFP
jgi:hypothetical protein